MDNEKWVWIQTRDGSPTLWDQNKSEPYRSTKGAFLESGAVFVGPALRWAKEHWKTKTQPIHVFEFGLGPGTNWLLWSLGAGLWNIPFRYVAIESDDDVFLLGLDRWKNTPPSQLKTWIEVGLNLNVSETWIAKVLPQLQKPQVFKSIEALPTTEHFELWFHDPFGIEVNAEGYSPQVFSSLSKHWSNPGLGLSYACNRFFRDALQLSLPHKTQILVQETGIDSLKRDRLEWSIGF